MWVIISGAFAGSVSLLSSPMPINMVLFLKESIFYNHSTAIFKKKCVSLRGLSFSRWFFQEYMLFWGLVSPLKFPCIEKFVLQRTDGELLEMRVWKCCTGNVCFYRFVSERCRCSTTSVFYGQESLVLPFLINYTIIIATTYHEKLVHGWKNVEQMTQHVKLSVSFVSKWE